MSWQSIIGQERVKNLLRSAWESGRLPHAMLFYGIEGVGKDAVAIEFARTLNCEQAAWEACEECPSCKASGKLQHPNIKLVFPLPVGKNEDEQHDPYERLDDAQMLAVREQIAMKAQHPYHEIRVPGASIIKISSIRDIKRESYLHASGKGRPVVIISGADRMNIQASNSLLKTLEEPTGNLLLILTTQKKDALLTTITSRCQHFRFDPLHNEEIDSAIRREYDISIEQAALVSRLANGSYRKAVAMLDADALSDRDAIVDFMRAVHSLNPHQIEIHAEKFTGSKDRNAVIDFLSNLIVWLRDIVALHNGYGDNIINVDLIVPLQKFAELYKNAPIEIAITSIERAIRSIGQNANILLVFAELSVRLHRTLQQGKNGNEQKLQQR